MVNYANLLKNIIDLIILHPTLRYNDLAQFFDEKSMGLFARFIGSLKLEMKSREIKLNDSSSIIELVKQQVQLHLKKLCGPVEKNILIF